MRTIVFLSIKSAAGFCSHYALEVVEKVVLTVYLIRLDHGSPKIR